MSTGTARAVKPPFHQRIRVRRPVSSLLPLARSEIARLAELEPCVVMGRGHSGTRVVAWMCHHLGIDMGADPRLVPSGDPVDRSFKHHMRAIAARSLDVRAVGETRFLDRNRFQRAIHRHLRQTGRASGRWGWKFPESYLTGPYVAETVPRARYVHLLRDGRDIAFKRHLTDAPEHRLARRILRRQGALNLPHHLQAAASWAFQVELFESFRTTLPPDRVLTLRYEDLATSPDPAAERIAAFLHVHMTEACRAYVAAEITPAHVGEYRSHDADAIRDVERLIGPTLEVVGYATGRDR